MSDRFTLTGNFRYGLDVRKSSLLELPGALLQLTNAFVNSGGECEQRKSFVKQANQFDGSVFGLEVTASGLVAFGAGAGPFTMPTGVSYRQCPHPTGFNSVGSAAVMTAVAFSCNYNGKAFVLAVFDDTNTFAYYGDVSPMPLVGEVRRNGLVIYTGSGIETVANLATDLTTILNTFSGFVATANVDENGTAINGDVVLKTSPGVHAGFTPTVQSPLGNLTAVLVDQNNAGVQNSSATAAFNITGAGGGTIELTAPATIGGTGTAALTGGTVSGAGTPAAVVSLVISKVNSLTSVHGYTASHDPSDGTKVIISAPQSWGAAPNAPFLLTVNVVTVTVAGATAPFSAGVTPNPAIINRFQQTIVTCNLTGATGTPAFTWSVVQNNIVGGFLNFTQSGQTCAISVFTIGGFSGTAVMQCVAVDVGGTGNSSTATFTVASGLF